MLNLKEYLLHEQTRSILLLKVKLKIGSRLDTNGSLGLFCESMSIPNAVLAITSMVKWVRDLKYRHILTVHHEIGLIYVCVFFNEVDIYCLSYLVSKWLINCRSGWRSVNTLASHRCDPDSIPGVGMWDGHVVIKSDRWVSPGYSGLLPHEDHRCQRAWLI